MVWTLPPPDQRRPQGQGGKGRRTVRWPPATTTPPPHEPLAGAQATGEPHPDNYVGEWEDEMGNRLSIRKIDDETCVVSFFGARDHQPIRRPWCAGKLSVDMVAKYRPENGPELVVELGGEGTGFTLQLNFEAAYILDDAERDALVPALSRYEEDDFLDQYYRYFKPLKHYTTRTASQAHSPRGGER